MLRHVPFLEAIASYDAEDDPRWAADVAAFLVLRMVDRWLLEGSFFVPDEVSITALRRRVLAIPDAEKQARTLLSRTVSIIADAEGANMSPIAEPLLGLATYLESAGRIPQAADVRDTVAGAIAISAVPPSSKPRPMRNHLN